jgi:glycosyltransferase involved in cell wall biosynthesis
MRGIKMRILFIAPSYHPHIGGVEYVVKSVAERLARAGHEVTVVAGEPNTDKPYEEVVNGVRVARWPIWSPGSAYHIPRKRGELERFLKKLARHVDVVHVHSVHSVFSMYSLRVIKQMGVRIVVTPYYHGTGHTVFRRLLWVFWRKHVRSLLKGCTVHAVSKLEARLVKMDFGVSATPIENGVEEWVRNLRWDPQGYVLYSGRIERYKNVDLLARIVKMLNDVYGLGLELKVFGRGPYAEKLRRFLKELGIPHEIGDFKPFNEYIHVLSHATLFGLLSKKESYPQSVNEANAIGVPTVIALPWSANFEGRRRTLVVNLGQDADAIARTVHEFLESAPREERSLVPTWSEVVLEYLKRLYGG